MDAVPVWFERKFDFTFPVELHPNLCARLRGTPARLEELVRGHSPEALVSKPALFRLFVARLPAAIGGKLRTTLDAICAYEGKPWLLIQAALLGVGAGACRPSARSRTAMARATTGLSRAPRRPYPSRPEQSQNLRSGAQ